MCVVCRCVCVCVVSVALHKRRLPLFQIDDWLEKTVLPWQEQLMQQQQAQLLQLRAQAAAEGGVL
jgi:hypothetical protein